MSQHLPIHPYRKSLHFSSSLRPQEIDGNINVGLACHFVIRCLLIGRTEQIVIAFLRKLLDYFLLLCLSPTLFHCATIKKSENKVFQSNWTATFTTTQAPTTVIHGRPLLRPHNGRYLPLAGLLLERYCVGTLTVHSP